LSASKLSARPSALATAADEAAAQQYTFSGATTDFVTVSLGGQSFSTPTAVLAEHGFQAWTHQAFTFTADSINPVLSFLATGTPSGTPPFSLIDGFTMTAVPEASTLFLSSITIGCLAFRRNRAKRRA
jgi:hypothetical protein